MAETPGISTNAATAPVQLSCAELWGGNTRVDNTIMTPGVVGHLLSIPSDGARGGDVHFVTVCNSGLIARMILGDVVGHGEEVAAVGAEIHQLLRSHLNTANQSRILGQLNRRLEKGGFGNMTTVVAVTYTPWLKRLSVSYAGHPPGWLYRASKQGWERLEFEESKRENPYADIPLAVESLATYSRHELSVAEGDRLVLVTDGVLEAPLSSGEMLGVEGFATFLKEHTKTPPEELTHKLVEAVGLSPEQRPSDDLSILVADFQAAPKGLLWRGMLNRLTTFASKSNLKLGSA